METICGQDPYGLDYTNPTVRKCVEATIRSTGGSDSAVDFFNATDQFLVEYYETGQVDWGRASALWVNMSRGSPVLLNTVPTDVLFDSQVIPAGWELDERYTALLADISYVWDEDVSIWAEYATITALDDNRFVIAYPLLACRACEMRAWVQVELIFDAGVLIEQNLLPPLGA